MRLAWLLFDLRVTLRYVSISFGWLVSTVKNEVRLGVGFHKICQCCLGTSKECKVLLNKILSIQI